MKRVLSSTEMQFDSLNNKLLVTHYAHLFFIKPEVFSLLYTTDSANVWNFRSRERKYVGTKVP